MNRAQIIAVATLSLAVISFIFWMVARSSDTAGPSIGNFTDDDGKFTYKDMMNNMENKHFYEKLSNDGEQDSAIIITKRLEVESHATGRLESSVDPAAQKAVDDIRSFKADIKKEGKREDEIIAEIVKRETKQDYINNSTNASRNVEESSLPVNSSSNNLVFGTPQKNNLNVLVKAVILNTVDVRNGSTVRIMVLDNVELNGVAFTNSMIVKGIVSIRDSRVLITIPGHDTGQQTGFFSVCDKDGVEGLLIEGSINTEDNPTKEAVKEEAEQQISQVVGGGMIGSVVRVMKSFGAVKREVAVKIPAGYKVLIKTFK
ncbi:uncharacterized protein DUF3714 [Chitinophaga skermanii]|uniref:Uncharacterized protein DUF3714 n=2 Tax=Chitinophaga skermanii TaxID=331697 RepID=A0A327Q1C8_9BACT|nr:uncharacterized protein DUF3714 [Chitinophaga skermanii]